jgi:hypothetical protein
VPKSFPRFSQRLYASERICSSEGFGWSMQPFYRVNGIQYCAFRSPGPACRRKSCPAREIRPPVRPPDHRPATAAKTDRGIERCSRHG